MSARLLAALVAATALLPAAAICQPDRSPDNEASNSADSANAAPEDQAPPEAGPKHRLLTPDQQGHEGLVKGVVEAPLRDLNVMHSHVPPVLTRAMANPYERPSPDTCQGITAEVRVLYRALGPDYDEATEREHKGLLSRGAIRNDTLDGLREGEKDYIPFDGVIRMVSGASRHDRLVLAAIQAGAARRAYLKGLGDAQGCGEPAAPSHYASTGVRRDPGFGEYPRRPRERGLTER